MSQTLKTQQQKGQSLRSVSFLNTTMPKEMDLSTTFTWCDRGNYSRTSNQVESSVITGIILRKGVVDLLERRRRSSAM